MVQLSIRIDFERSDGTLGPGMAQLLDRVAASGSIRRAAASMDMSYRKAWLLIQAMQETFGGEVVTTATGGAAGGGAKLTELGTALLKCYRRIEARALRNVEPELRALSSLIKESAAPGRYRRRKRKHKRAAG